MDALDLLKRDHREVKELFQEAEGKQKFEVFKKIKTALETHTRIEETIFTPRWRKKNS